MNQAARTNNNVVQWSEIVLEARKPFRPARSLETLDALVIRRLAGMGDVLMALSAAAAIHRTVGIPVYLETSAAFRDLAVACPDVAGVFTTPAEAAAFVASAAGRQIRQVDWSPAGFGISRLHQVDAFLMSLGLTLPDASKGLDLDLADEVGAAAILDGLPDGCRRVVLHPGVTDPNRTWPAAFWSDLAADLVAAGDAVIVIGAHASQDGRGVASIAHPLVVDLTDRLTPSGTIRLLRRCDVLVSGDSGPIQLAGASDIAVVGLYSVVAGRNRLPFRNGSTEHKAAAIAPACPFHPCYPRLQDPEAVTRFCAEERIAPSDTPALFARWCINPDRYACTREPETLAKVMAAVAAADARAVPPRCEDDAPNTVPDGGGLVPA